MKALVTGAGGFVGSALVAHLAATGWEVIGVCRSWKPVAGVPGGVRFAFGDLREAHFLSRLLVEHRPDFIFHLAAHAIVSESREQPMYTLMNNMGATAKVMEVVRRHPGPRVILASTDKAFGNMPLGEMKYRNNGPLNPQGVYETSKACSDLVANAYRESFGVRVIALRPCNIYGPGDRHLSRLVPKVCKAITREGTLRLYRHPDYLREYLYVEDACRAYAAAAEHFDALMEDGAFAWNVSSEERLRTSDVVRTAESLASFRMEWTDGTLPLKEVGDQALDGAPFARITGWGPRLAFQPGLKQTLEWWGAQ